MCPKRTRVHTAGPCGFLPFWWSQSIIQIIWYEMENDDNVGCWCCICSLLVLGSVCVCGCVYLLVCLVFHHSAVLEFFSFLDIGFIHEITVYPCNIESIDWHRSLTEYSWNAFLSHSTASVDACCQQPLIKYRTLSLLNDDFCTAAVCLVRQNSSPAERPSFIFTFLIMPVVLNTKVLKKIVKQRCLQD